VLAGKSLLLLLLFLLFLLFLLLLLLLLGVGTPWFWIKPVCLLSSFPEKEWLRSRNIFGYRGPWI
jgi:hypothetical protein